MAEIAGGAVRTLLGVIKNEMNRLGHVEHDVQFIKEEMESMSSFLMHLARTTPPGQEHDEQVRTWMKQVRELAHDCNNSIDRYLRNGDRAIYRARSSLGYLWWVPWYLRMLVAQYTAASELRELKARARDVGERRQRYGVMVPSEKAKQEAHKTETTPPALAETIGTPLVAATSTLGDAEEDGDEMYTSRRRALAFNEPCVLKKCTEELLSWLKGLKEDPNQVYEGKFPAIAIVAPDKEDGVEVVNDALADTSVVDESYHRICISPDEKDGVHLQGPLEILEKIKQVLEVQSDNTEKSKVIDNTIKEIEDKVEKHLQACTGRSWAAPLHVLLDVLQELLPKQDDKDHLSNKMTMEEETVLEIMINGDKPGPEKLEEAARKMIKLYLKGKGFWVDLDRPEYIGILKQLLPRPKEGKAVSESKDRYQGKAEGETNKPLQEGKWENKLGEDQIEEKVKDTMEKVVAKMLLQLLPKPNEDSDQLDEEDLSHEEIKENIKGTLKNVRDQLLIEEMVKKISEYLGVGDKKTLIILEGATADCLGNWEKINCALNKMGCGPGSALIVTTKHDSRDAATEKYFHTIKYSLVGYYRDKADMLIQHTRFVTEERRIFGEILKKCEPHKFCMKMFVCALYANPKRTIEELQKLNDKLSSGGHDEQSKAKKMIKFSYNELHRDYKTCLLYLAIFPALDDRIRPRDDRIRPRDDRIRTRDDMIISRSRLVARWVAEGLIAGEDWSRSVRRANQCFDELANRWLVCPEAIGATGKVKSCTVNKLVHNCITEMAREEHITDIRLSHHLARHFSIGSDIRLRPTEDMNVFLKNPSSASFQVELLKVLDLEGCRSLNKENQKHLKNVCNKIILLKFLSLRNTDISQLPKEINKLQQLEVLDIRQTFLGINAIKNLMLMKLKHLLAGGIHQSTGGNNGTRTKESFSAVQMPGKTRRMKGLEVLSHVQASPRHHDSVLRDIGQLWQLRKLGVSIYDSEAQIQNLLHGISDLHECLQSLSVEIKAAAPEDDQGHVWSWPTRGRPIPAGKKMKWCCCAVAGVGESSARQRVDDIGAPKFLKSLRIIGRCEVNLLKLLLDKGHEALAKVTLHSTLLSQDDMELLSKLDKLCSLTLRNVTLSHPHQQLTFKAGKKSKFDSSSFEALRYVAVEGGNINSISFEDLAAPCLEKVIWSFGSTEIKSFSVTSYHNKLQEVEFNGDHVIPSLVEQAQKECPEAKFKHNKPLNQGQAT